MLNYFCGNNYTIKKVHTLIIWSYQHILKVEWIELNDGNWEHNLQDQANLCTSIRSYIATLHGRERHDAECVIVVEFNNKTSLP